MKLNTKHTEHSWLFFGKLKVAMLVVIFMLSNLLPVFGNAGSKLFTKHCGTCHSLTEAKIVGPGLKDITQRRSKEWLVSWIKNSPELIQSNDADAVALFNQYNQLPMPAFPQLSDAQVSEILDYLEDPYGAKSSPEEGVVPLVEQNQDKEESLSTRLVYGFLFGALIILVLVVILYKNVVNAVNKQGGVAYHLWSGANPFMFLIASTVVLGAVMLAIQRLGDAGSASNFMLFAVFPYSMILIFFIGTIYRYRKSGFQVSSLSSQFLETKKLFWGSTPFHWGLLFLFFGHLIAFVIPSAVLAWNGHSWRLLILEISSFGFALCTILGLILLTRRRLMSKRLMMVTSRADLLVYAVLFLQLITGLGTAYFVRWGSSWFAGVLTPYLRSLFVFNPNIDAVSSMPIWIQLHIISAFFIIGLIPFTRFMHFMVAPIDYIWRRYQLVLWNWDRKNIRNSKSHYPGQKIRNH
jgi:nitrate reductase gamma subunit